MIEEPKQEKENTLEPLLGVFDLSASQRITHAIVIMLIGTLSLAFYAFHNMGPSFDLSDVFHDVSQWVIFPLYFLSGYLLASCLSVNYKSIHRNVFNFAARFVILSIWLYMYINLAMIFFIIIYLYFPHE